MFGSDCALIKIDNVERNNIKNLFIVVTYLFKIKLVAYFWVLGNSRVYSSHRYFYRTNKQYKIFAIHNFSDFFRTTITEFKV